MAKKLVQLLTSFGNIMKAKNSLMVGDRVVSDIYEQLY
jgi:hypothetical protein